jgi:uncharacterized LabA/DUF88 family protein
VADRVVVFVDWQNAYNRARDCFHGPNEAQWCGQVNPMQLGQCLTRKRPDRDLQQVRVYRGIPTPEKDPKGHAASRRQVAAWMKSAGGSTDRLHVVLHPLQYLPGKAPREKGIDVELAIDMAMMAVRGEYDVAILVSADTDLRPAVNAVYDTNGSEKPWVEIAGWRGPHDKRRIAASPPRRAGGLWIEQADYDAMQDTTDYNIGK